MRIGFESNKREDKASESSRQLLKVAIVGTGRMGRCLSRLLKSHCELMICSKKHQKARTLAKKLGVVARSINDCVAESDIIIAAIPTERLQSFAEEISSLMRPRSLFVDISSVKCGVVEVLSQTLSDNVEYASIHPLFASPNVKQKNVIVVPVRSSAWVEKLKNLLALSGMCVSETTADKHDRAMATTQVLHHFAYLALRNALAKWNYGPDMSPFMTHSFRKSMAALKLIERNMDTVRLIQERNKYAQCARELLIKEAISLDEEFAV